MSPVCVTALLHVIGSPCRPVSSCTGDVHLSVSSVPRMTCVRVLSWFLEVRCNNRWQSRRETLVCVCRCVVKSIPTESQQLYSSIMPASRQACVLRPRLAQFRSKCK